MVVLRVGGQLSYWGVGNVSYKDAILKTLRVFKGHEIHQISHYQNADAYIVIKAELECT